MSIDESGHPHFICVSLSHRRQNALLVAERNPTQYVIESLDYIRLLMFFFFLTFFLPHNYLQQIGLNVDHSYIGRKEGRKRWRNNKELYSLLVVSHRMNYSRWPWLWWPSTYINDIVDDIKWWPYKLWCVDLIFRDPSGQFLMTSPGSYRPS